MSDFYEDATRMPRGNCSRGLQAIPNTGHAADLVGNPDDERSRPRRATRTRSSGVDGESVLVGSAATPSTRRRGRWSTCR